MSKGVKDGVYRIKEVRFSEMVQERFLGRAENLTGYSECVTPLDI